MKIKICFVMKYMATGGVEKSLINLCKILSPDKYDITVLLLCNEDGISNELPCYVKRIFINNLTGDSLFEKKYIKFWNKYHDLLPERCWDYSRNKYVRLLYYHLIMLNEFIFGNYVRRKMSHFHYDYSVGYLSDEPSYIATQAIKAKNKVIFCHFGTTLHFIFEHIYYKKADKVIAVSGGSEELLCNIIGVQKYKLYTIYNIHDTDAILIKSKEYCELDDIGSLKIVTVARISKEKGIIQAIDAEKKQVMILNGILWALLAEHIMKVVFQKSKNMNLKIWYF